VRRRCLARWRRWWLTDRGAVIAGSKYNKRKYFLFLFGTVLQSDWILGGSNGAVIGCKADRCGNLLGLWATTDGRCAYLGPQRAAQYPLIGYMGHLFSFIKIRHVCIVFSHVSGIPLVLLRIRFCAVAYTTSVEKPRGSRHLEEGG